MRYIFLTLLCLLGPRVSVQEATLQATNYTPFYNHYVYELPYFDPIELSEETVQEIATRDTLCQKDPACWRVYPISEETWSELQVQLYQQSGVIAARELIRGRRDLAPPAQALPEAPRSRKVRNWGLRRLLGTQPPA